MQNLYVRGIFACYFEDFVYICSGAAKQYYR